jgi:hypothetical protein
VFWIEDFLAASRLEVGMLLQQLSELALGHAYDDSGLG